MYCKIKVICFLQYITCLCKCICYDCVKYNVRSGNGITGSYHTELEFVACKCKW